MEEQTKDNQEIVDKVYNYAADLMVNHKKNSSETIEALLAQGLDEEIATTVVSNLEQQISVAKKERAKKDMLYGALWCVGGTIATVSNIGYIFWGAIVFGGIQFFKGLANS
jgi:hypothetical protein